NLGGITAPFSILSYEDAKIWAPVISLRLKDGSMPPWGAHRQHQGTFKNERYISDEDKQLLIDWIEAGALQGDPAEQLDADELALSAPPNEPVQAPDGSMWWMGVPDARVAFREPVEVCEEVTDWQPTILMQRTEGDLSKHQWIQATEILTGSTMHHVVSNYLGVAVPGRRPQVYPEGWGFLLPADPFVTIGMHYAKQSGPGTAVEDNTVGGFLFYEPGDVIDYVVQNTIPMNRDIVIPPGDPNYMTTHEHTIEEDILLLAIAPHSHYRGKAVKVELQLPGVDERETLLWVPNYDFNWQFHYEYQEPRFLPAGSKYHVTWWFDNSADNPANPDPTAEVRWGARSVDEMMNARYFFTRAEPQGIVVGDAIPESILAQARRREQFERGQYGGWDTENLSQLCGP
ncbi:MAG: hypothetical protein QGG54_05635, partial [Gammaproteobacteria bacterium]|nr:hypothetical protein [Gammaproteobacteria bacterium]